MSFPTLNSPENIKGGNNNGADLEKISSEEDLIKKKEDKHNLIIKLVFKYALLIASLLMLTLLCYSIIVAVSNDVKLQQQLLNVILNNLEVVVVFLVGLFLGQKAFGSR